MRVLGYLAMGFVLIAAFKAAIVLGAVVLLIMFLFQLITRPAETFALALGLTLLGMAQAHPLAGLIILGGIIATGLIARDK